MGCEVINFQEYRKKALEKRNLASKKLKKSSSQLNLMAALIDCYQAQMQTMAKDPEVLVLCHKKGIDAQAQIASDVGRLYDLREALRVTLAEKGAQDLEEAAQLVRFWADIEIVHTLDRLLSSEYEGFQKIAQLLVPALEVAQEDQVERLS